ncbi:hypothetical protein VB780_07400 [Leptolyngbya sp. CCNP1308]|nr:hypothetical protein [Leptolyngbya sp. CCNP1308]MEA5448386.1 hypothetical protein [Leptolyngbya sp. CCNP1308]
MPNRETQLIEKYCTSEAQFWQQASQTSLDSIWDNQDDDVYAQLL